MPYKSDAQRKYFNVHRKELEAQGVDVDEWNKASKGKKLPEKVKDKEASDALNMLQRQSRQMLAAIKQAAEDEESTAKKEKKPNHDEVSKEEKHKAREKLGPMEHAYIADAAGGQALANLGKKYDQMKADSNNPYKSYYDRFLLAQSGLAGAIGERINRGSSRMAESPLWRILSRLDPTASEQNEGIVGALSGFGGGADRAQGAKRRAAEAYTKFLAKHQDTLDPTAKPSERQTPYHLNLQAMLANLDSDVAGHRYMRKERPFHYWLNPVSKSGPLSEISNRMQRRAIAGLASPETTKGRVAMQLGNLATLGLLGPVIGGKGEQQRLRAAAAQNQMYSPEATPKTASDIACLARVLVKQARCWEGYEPVPGKAPYSEDSCRPKGSDKKKTEKKSSCGCSGCGGDADACTCDKDSDDTMDSDVTKLARMLAKQASGAWTRREGQSESGGLNAKGRASLKAQGHDIKEPVTESDPKGERAGRKSSFCARMGGMKKKLTSSETANDPDSRINKALRKWNC